MLGLKPSVLLNQPVDCHSVIVLIRPAFPTSRTTFKQTLQFPPCLILALGLLSAISLGVPTLGCVGIHVPAEVNLDGDVIRFIE